MVKIVAAMLLMGGLLSLVCGPAAAAVRIEGESADIDAVTQAVKAGRSLSRAGLYWNASCLKEIGSPKFWSKKALEPVLAQYNKDHPAPSQRPPPICKGQRASNFR
jgi:hypothetical protein